LKRLNYIQLFRRRKEKNIKTKIINSSLPRRKKEKGGGKGVEGRPIVGDSLHRCPVEKKEKGKEEWTRHLLITPRVKKKRGKQLSADLYSVRCNLLVKMDKVRKEIHESTEYQSIAYASSRGGKKKKGRKEGQFFSTFSLTNPSFPSYCRRSIEKRGGKEKGRKKERGAVSLLPFMGRSRKEGKRGEPICLAGVLCQLFAFARASCKRKKGEEGSSE